MKADFRTRPGEPVDLAKWPTRTKPLYSSRKKYREMLDGIVADIDARQRLQYAGDRHAILLIFQGMDASGKDGVIRNVLSGVNPQGCRVHSFKQPSEAELRRDFLWRTTLQLPERGKIGVFNRSYYEEVLVVRVHPELLDGRRIAVAAQDRDSFWKSRYRSILDFEAHLLRNGTRIVKFFLHLSFEEQRRRFLERIDAPDKNWKFTLADIEARREWPRYMRAYEDCLGATSTARAPWHIVPADDKRNARLIVARIVRDAFGELKANYPEIGPERRKELEAIRARLAKSPEPAAAKPKAKK